jgi:hypothetical protein
LAIVTAKFTVGLVDFQVVWYFHADSPAVWVDSVCFLTTSHSTAIFIWCSTVPIAFKIQTASARIWVERSLLWIENKQSSYNQR